MKKLLVLVMGAVFILPACYGSGSNNSGTDDQSVRSFKMGFTPWPCVATIDAVNDTYSFIDVSSGMIARHMDLDASWNGVKR